MNTYLSTFISGFSEIIRKILKEEFSDLKISYLLDGLIVYQTDSSPEKIKKLPFFNNSFYLIRPFPSKNQSIEDVIKLLIQDSNLKIDLSPSENHKTFRVVVSKENQALSVNKVLLKKLEQKLSSLYRISLNPTNPDLEFWITIRREGYGFFTFRITYHPSSEKSLQKGELRPELAYLLSSLSKPSPQDVILDPFAGSGSIPKAIAEYFPYQKIYAIDINQKLTSDLEQKTKNISSVIVSQGDALNLKDFPNQSADKIVTDPPWGFYEKNLDLFNFYHQMLQEFCRVLKVDGQIILLIANKELFESVLEKFLSSLKLEQKINILVSGKKAGVYRLRKI